MALTKLTTNLISGDIVTSVNGASGAVTVSTGTDWVTAIQTANFTSVASKGYFVNTTSAEVTVTLPVGAVGDEIVIQDYAGTFAANRIILAANGSEKIQGSANDFQCNTNNATLTLIYQDATKGWTSDNIVINLLPLTVDYLVVAGGGSGPGTHGGGGGAGGLRTSFGSNSGGGSSAETTLTLQVLTNYTATIGAGGSAPGAGGNNGNSGSSSVFHTITSIGGGWGEYYSTSGGTGGSGGGSSYGHPGGLGTANQGYAGGAGLAAYQNGTGGGGASQAGNANASNAGGNGGDGLAVSITGSSVYYAGGGGGGLNGSGTLGSGGTGGGGSATTGVGQSGTANTGGGGAGGHYSPHQSGGSGGSGVIILRYPSDYTISPLSGSGGFTYTTDTSISNTKVTTFTAAGGGNMQFTI